MVSIGILSEQTGISTQAIRYYERIGILPEPQRAENGYRMYGQSDVERLQFIRRARALDFSLDQIGEILALREREVAPCDYVLSVMETRITEIEVRMRDLRQLRDEIQALHEAGQNLPADTRMKGCVCSLIRSGQYRPA